MEARDDDPERGNQAVKMLAAITFVVSLAVPAMMQPQVVIPDVFVETAKQLPLLALFVWWSVRVNDTADARMAKRDEQHMAAMENRDQQYLAAIEKINARIDEVNKSVSHLMMQPRTRKDHDTPGV